MLNIYAYYCTLLNPNSLKTFPQNMSLKKYLNETKL